MKLVQKAAIEILKRLASEMDKHIHNKHFSQVAENARIMQQVQYNPSNFVAVTETNGHDDDLINICKENNIDFYYLNGDETNGISNEFIIRAEDYNRLLDLVREYNINKQQELENEENIVNEPEPSKDKENQEMNSAQNKEEEAEKEEEPKKTEETKESEEKDKPENEDSRFDFDEAESWASEEVKEKEDEEIIIHSKTNERGDEENLVSPENIVPDEGMSSKESENLLGDVMKETAKTVVPHEMREVDIGFEL